MIIPPEFFSLGTSGTSGIPTPSIEIKLCNVPEVGTTVCHLKSSLSSLQHFSLLGYALRHPLYAVNPHTGPACHQKLCDEIQIMTQLSLWASLLL